MFSFSYKAKSETCENYSGDSFWGGEVKYDISLLIWPIPIYELGKKVESGFKNMIKIMLLFFLVYVYTGRCNVILHGHK